MHIIILHSTRVDIIMTYHNQGLEKKKCLVHLSSFKARSNFPRIPKNPSYNYMSIITLHLHLLTRKMVTENVDFYHISLIVFSNEK